MLNIEIRNQIAFKKVTRMASKAFYLKYNVDVWSIHIRGLSPEDFDYKKARNVLIGLLFSGTSLLEIINRLHEISDETILEDKEITLKFFELCEREYYI